MKTGNNGRIAAAIVAVAAAGAVLVACGSDSESDEAAQTQNDHGVAEMQSDVTTDEPATDEPPTDVSDDLAWEEQYYWLLRTQMPGVSKDEILAEGWAACQVISDGGDLDAVLAEFRHLDSDVQRNAPSFAVAQLCPELVDQWAEIEAEG